MKKLFRDTVTGLARIALLAGRVLEQTSTRWRINCEAWQGLASGRRDLAQDRGKRSEEEA